MASQAEFAAFLVRLTVAIPRFAPNMDNANTLRVWYGEMGHLAATDLDGIYRQAVSKFDEFPSMRQLLAIVGQAKPSAEDTAREVGERIYAGLSKFGDLNGESGRQKWAQQIAPYLGPIGVRVVEMQGGWNNLCATVREDDATTWKAQWRGLAEALSRRGPDAAPPDWDQLPARPELLELAGRFQ